MQTIDTALDDTPRRTSNGAPELIVRDRGRAFRLDVADIDWLSAEDNYVRIHSNGRSLLIRGTIGGLQRALGPDRFIRIHRSAIVNICRARELRPLVRGGYAIVLGSGEKLRVSRTHRQQITRLFTDRAPPTISREATTEHTERTEDNGAAR
jgi:two-component system LytT family response regulator